MALTSKDEYLKASRGLATGFGPTADFADAQVGATSQSKDGIGVSQSDLPGQVFSVDQLPDPAVAKAFGLPPVSIPAALILDSTSDAESHIQGKSPEDIASADLRRSLNDPTLAFDNVVREGDDALKSFTDRTGENAYGDTDNGRPVDPENVQKADAGGTDSVPAADGGTQDSKAGSEDDSKSGSKKSDAKK